MTSKSWSPSPAHRLRPWSALPRIRGDQDHEIIKHARPCLFHQLITRKTRIMKRLGVVQVATLGGITCRCNRISLGLRHFLLLPGLPQRHPSLGVAATSPSRRQARGAQDRSVATPSSRQTRRVTMAMTRAATAARLIARSAATTPALKLAI